MQDTERIKEKMSIDDLVGQYVDLKPAGRSLTARCPFHEEKTPSFYVTPDRGIYKCFGCGKGGDIFSFVQDIEGVEFRESLEILADKAGVVLSKTITPKDPKKHDKKERLYELMDISCKWYQVQFRQTSHAVEYVKSRGVKKQTMIDFKIGYAKHQWGLLADILKQRGFSDTEIIESGMGIKGKKGVYDRFRARIMIPILDTQGRVIAFSARTDPVKQSAHTEKAAKYINSPETPLFDKSKALLGINVAKSWWGKRKRAVIVEGAFDVILAHQAGTHETVAVSGTALTPEHIKQIKRLVPVIYTVFDGDVAGQRATDRSTTHALEQGLDVKVVALPLGSDPADIISEDVAKWSAALNCAKPFFTALVERLDDEGLFQKNLGSHATFKVVREKIYPLVGYVQDGVVRAYTLGSVANLLGVSQKIIEEDFKSFQMKKIKDKKINTSAVGGGVSASKRISLSKKQSLVGGFSLLGYFLKNNTFKDPKALKQFHLLLMRVREYPFYSASLTRTIVKYDPQILLEYETLISARHGCNSLENTIVYLNGLLDVLEKEHLQNIIKSIERGIRIHQKAELIPRLNALKQKIQLL